MNSNPDCSLGVGRALARHVGLKPDLQSNGFVGATPANEQSGFNSTSSQCGFTLIETLVALVIAATAAAVILSQVRTLMLRAEKEQSHQLAVLQLLNDSLRVSYGSFANAPAPRLEQDTLLLEAGNTPDGAMPPVRVRNFSPRGEKLPPISFAYTPFQLFATERDRYAIHAVSAALASPVAAAASAATATAR